MSSPDRDQEQDAEGSSEINVLGIAAVQSEFGGIHIPVAVSTHFVIGQINRSFYIVLKLAVRHVASERAASGDYKRAKDEETEFHDQNNELSPCTRLYIRPQRLPSTSQPSKLGGPSVTNPPNSKRRTLSLIHSHTRVALSHFSIVRKQNMRSYQFALITGILSLVLCVTATCPANSFSLSQMITGFCECYSGYQPTCVDRESSCSSGCACMQYNGQKIFCGDSGCSPRCVGCTCGNTHNNQSIKSSLFLLV